MKTTRTLHRIAGLVLAAFLISSAVTGLIWGLSHHIYWTKDYLKPKHPAAAVDVDTIRVQPIDAIHRAQEATAPSAKVMSVTLRREATLTIYEVTLRDGKKSRSALVDASTGALRSPLTREDAALIAKQYVKPAESTVASVRLDPRWISRRNDPPRPAMVVAFSQPEQTEIVLDPDSAKVLEESDPTRRVHFFITRLHQLDYFGTDKLLIVIPGAGLLMMTVTGLLLTRKRRSRRLETAS